MEDVIILKVGLNLSTTTGAHSVFVRGAQRVMVCVCASFFAACRARQAELLCLLLPTPNTFEVEGSSAGGEDALEGAKLAQVVGKRSVRNGERACARKLRQGVPTTRQAH